MFFSDKIQSFISGIRNLRKNRLFGYSQKILGLFVTAVISLIKLVPLFIFIFFILSLIKGGEPFRRIRQVSDHYFRENYIAQNASISEITGFPGRCRAGIMSACDVLADKGEKILEIRRELLRTEKEREAVGENTAEHIKKIIQLKNDHEEKPPASANH